MWGFWFIVAIGVYVVIDEVLQCQFPIKTTLNTAVIDCRKVAYRNMFSGLLTLNNLGGRKVFLKNVQYLKKEELIVFLNEFKNIVWYIAVEVEYPNYQVYFSNDQKIKQDSYVSIVDEINRDLKPK